MNSSKASILRIFYIIVFLAFSYRVLLRGSNQPIYIDQQKFESIVLQGDAKKITLVTNKNLVEVMLTDEALKNDAYMQDFLRHHFIVRMHGISPQYLLKVPSAEIFHSNFQALQAR